MKDVILALIALAALPLVLYSEDSPVARASGLSQASPVQPASSVLPSRVPSATIRASALSRPAIHRPAISTAHLSRTLTSSPASPGALSTSDRAHILRIAECNTWPARPQKYTPLDFWLRGIEANLQSEGKLTPEIAAEYAKYIQSLSGTRRKTNNTNNTNQQHHE